MVLLSSALKLISLSGLLHILRLMSFIGSVFCFTLFTDNWCAAVCMLSVKTSVPEKTCVVGLDHYSFSHCNLISGHTFLHYVCRLGTLILYAKQMQWFTSISYFV